MIETSAQLMFYLLAFVALVAGIILATAAMVLLLEILHHRFTKKK